MDMWAVSVLAIISQVATNILVQTLLWTYAFVPSGICKYLGVDLLGHGHYFH